MVNESGLQKNIIASGVEYVIEISRDSPYTKPSGIGGD